MKPNVLCVCTMGLNRSKYLANYLSIKGYDTRYRGIGPFKYQDFKVNLLNEDDIRWADVIIGVRPKHGKQLENYDIIDKRIILLNVTDSQKRISSIYPEYKDMDNETFNQKWTYPELRKAIDRYLPL